MPVPCEIELKLEILPGGAEALLASGLMGDTLTETMLHATYFDTPGHELHRHGHSLRVRHSGGMAVQTVKTGDVAAGLFARGEWELPLVGHRPVADSRTPVSDLLATRLSELVPLFRIDSLRSSGRLHSGNAVIEVAVDRAEAVASERLARFCEVELELVSGSSAALFALARKLDAKAPVRIGALSKAERGYRLLGPQPDSVKAEALRVDPEMDLSAAFGAIASACLRQYRLNEAILLERQVPEAVHQARIGLRRLRSAMTLFRDLLTGPERDGLNARMRELAACLGEARDWDVLAAEARAGPVLERVGHARDAARAAMNRKLKSKDTRLLLLDLTEWIADGSWRSDPATQALQAMPLREFAAAALERRRRKVVEHGRHLASLDPEARHQLRKDAKKLRYAVEFLAPLFDRGSNKGRQRRFLKALQALQDDLGALNDLASAEERLASLGLVGTPEVRSYLAAWKTGNLLESAAKARAALLEVTPFWR